MPCIFKLLKNEVAPVINTIIIGLVGIFLYPGYKSIKTAFDRAIEFADDCVYTVLHCFNFIVSHLILS